MSEIKYDSSGVVAVDYYGNRIKMLDFQNFFINKSRLPMHLITQNKINWFHEDTVFGYLVKLSDKYEQFFQAQNNDTSKLHKHTMLIISLFIAKILVETALPVKVCEIGCDEGSLSYLLAEVTGKFNPSSHLCLVSNTIGNDGNNRFLDAISLCENPPELSVAISDYDNTNLQSDSFDIVVINGNVNYSNPFDVVKEAERLVKKGGNIICYANHTPELESTLKTILDYYEAFCIIPDINILNVKYNGHSSESHKYDFKTDLKKFSCNLKYDIEHGMKDEKITDYFRKIVSLINYSVKCHDIEKKIYLIDVHEKLSDYMININTSEKNFYMERLINKLQGLE